MTNTGLLNRLMMAAALWFCAGIAIAAQPATHVIGIGACAPYKGIPPAICAEAVRDVTSALAERYDVPQAQIHTLVNKQATVDGLVAFFEALPDFTAQDSVLLYVVMHNGAGDGTQVATSKNDIMIFWSEDDPGATQFALFERKWLRASDFADMLKQMGAGRVVAMFDACHSGALAADVLHEMPQQDVRIATIASSTADEVANMNEDMTGPLFSSLLVSELDNTQGASFAQVVQTAAKQADTQARQICSERQSLMNKNIGQDVNCNQTPIIQDPSSLLEEF
ncbi:hypothetical protein ACN2XU_02275 [Primorskyibacter sp. 2E107]|uniref:hypothetical protein n=1 Tax=Primorskyibacter sp. 2E107 TaxID=3403458 RepID=UPI003AF43862